MVGLLFFLTDIELYYAISWILFVYLLNFTSINVLSSFILYVFFSRFIYLDNAFLLKWLPEAVWVCVAIAFCWEASLRLCLLFFWYYYLIKRCFFAFIRLLEDGCYIWPYLEFIRTWPNMWHEVFSFILVWLINVILFWANIVILAVWLYNFDLTTLVILMFFTVLILMLLILIIIRGGSIRIRIDQLNLSNFAIGLIGMLPIIIILLCLFVLL